MSEPAGPGPGAGAGAEFMSVGEREIGLVEWVWLMELGDCLEGCSGGLVGILGRLEKEVKYINESLLSSRVTSDQGVTRVLCLETWHLRPSHMMLSSMLDACLLMYP